MEQNTFHCEVRFLMFLLPNGTPYNGTVLHELVMKLVLQQKMGIDVCFSLRAICAFLIKYPISLLKRAFL